MPRRKGGKIVFVCTNPKCGYTIEATREEARKSSVRQIIRHTEKDRTIIIDADEELKGLPVTKEVTCPRCGYHEAYYYFQQTRAADEPMTRFFICKRCGYRWREYD